MPLALTDTAPKRKTLCVRLFNSGWDVYFLPGVHVWHDKTTLARDQEAQHQSKTYIPLLTWTASPKLGAHPRTPGSYQWASSTSG